MRLRRAALVAWAALSLAGCEGGLTGGGFSDYWAPTIVEDECFWTMAPLSPRQMRVGDRITFRSTWREDCAQKRPFVVWKAADVTRLAWDLDTAGCPRDSCAVLHALVPGRQSAGYEVYYFEPGDSEPTGGGGSTFNVDVVP
jgi:hypothetical protein